MQNKSIAQWQEEIYANNKEKGFWDEERNFGEMIALIHSELSEALEAHRKGKEADVDGLKRYMADTPNYDGEQEVAFLRFIKDSVADELADAVIRLFDVTKGLGIDLEFHIEQKIAYNKTRPHKHGKKY